MTTQIVADGEFGREVAGHLATLLTSSGVTARVAQDPDRRQIADLLAGCGYAIHAAWRDVSTEFDEFATAAAEAWQPWLPVVLAHPHIRIGPAFSPGLGPCHTCYRVRVRQHSDVDGEVTDALDRQQARDPSLGVAGYPPHLAALAAGLTIGMMRAASGDGHGRREPAGYLFEINYLTDAVRSWRVVPVHGCPQCHPDSDQQAAAKARADRLRELARLGHDGVESGGRSADS